MGVDVDADVSSTESEEEEGVSCEGLLSDESSFYGRRSPYFSLSGYMLTH